MRPFDPRHCLRFSMRCLFGLVTLAAAFVGWHASWIHQRHELLARHRAEEAKVDQREWNGIAAHDVGWMPGCTFDGSDPQPPFPVSLAVLGERPVRYVDLVFFARNFDYDADTFDHPDIGRAVELFPEATVRWRLYYTSPEHEQFMSEHP